MQKTQNDLKQKIKIDTNQDSSNYEYLLNARKSALNTKAKNKKFHWLTNHSRSFLAAGYIAEGVKPESRIREIANRAEEILGIKGFGDKFYGYMEQGFFSLSSPVWSNFGKKRGLRKPHPLRPLAKFMGGCTRLGLTLEVLPQPSLSTQK